MIGRLALAAGLLAGQATTVVAPIAPGAVALVLPFENPQNISRLHWMREGVALLIGEMLEAGGSAVVDRDERVLAYDRLQLPVAATLSRASAIKVGQVVGATAIVTGHLALDAGELVVSARVVRLDDGRLSGEVTARAAPEKLLDVVARVASALAEPTRDATRWHPPPSVGVFELFTRGLVADTPADRQSYFEQALDAAPDYAAVRLALWELHTEQGEHHRALDSVAGVAVTSPLHRDARYAAAMSLIQLRRLDDAFAVLSELQQEARSAGVSNALGVVQLRRGATPQTGRATYFFNQATEIEPAEVDYFFNLGYAYWLEEDPNGAAYWLHEAVRRNPSDGDAHFVLSAALQRRGSSAEALRERELASRLSSDYAAREVRADTPEAVPQGLERLHDRLNRPAARVDAFIASSDQRNQAELAAFHLEAARRAYDREADREAEGEVRRALFLTPYLTEAHVMLGRILLREGRANEAVQALTIAIWGEDTSDAEVLLAEASLVLGDTGTARVAVDRALRLDPDSTAAAALKARLPSP